MNLFFIFCFLANCDFSSFFVYAFQMERKQEKDTRVIDPSQMLKISSEHRLRAENLAFDIGDCVDVSLLIVMQMCGTLCCRNLHFQRDFCKSRVKKRRFDRKLLLCSAFARLC